MQDFIKATSALSDITRLRILNILLVRECCVCEVMQSLEISQTRASRNLSILYNAGYLSQRKEGLWTIYSIDKEGINRNNKKYLDYIIQAVSSALENNKTAEEDIIRLKKTQRVCPTCS
jgi:ArsR family transcriptional regulator